LEDSLFRGFLVHAYAQFGLRRGKGEGLSQESRAGGRIFLVGRLEDGRSFAAALSLPHAGFHIAKGDLGRCGVLLRSLSYLVLEPRLESFSGKEELVFLDFDSFLDRSRAFKILCGGGVQSPDGAEKPAETFLLERQIHGWMELRGPCRPGRHVDLVFSEPEIRAPAPGPASPYAPLRAASIDIETDTRGSGAVLAVGTAWTGALLPGPGPEARAASDWAEPPQGRLVRVLGSPRPGLPGDPALIFHADEAGLLRAFLADIRRIDPDVLTGWNFLDFDFKQIAQRCAYYHIPLLLGRSDNDEAKYFPPGGKGDYWGRGNSSAALVPGRQVLDALRIFRAGGRGFLAAEDGPSYRGGFSLEAVSRRVLGEGKLLSSQGEEKLAELERLYAEDPVQFGAYCLKDAELVLQILDSTGLFRLTVERAGLTAVSLDKAWTSVVSFERIYGMELRRLGIAPPFPDPAQDVSGAAGGTVLDSLPGLFNNIAVFDFRSLYPTIMRTFNIDPLSCGRAEAGPGEAAAGPDVEPVAAPNGAVFSREPGLLPRLIAGYFAERRNAIDRGNETAAQVYKILMNSFYGVLGTQSCRYGRTELAGAVTSFAKKWLYFSRDWFRDRGCRVLYGDTDSLFVETGLEDAAGWEDFNRLCGELAAELNRDLGERILREYRLPSFIELRFEKAYRRLLIPPLRNRAGETPEGEPAVLRGRAKGYGGYLIPPAGGREAVEVKGMEAVRSDVTALARRIQVELLELVFSGGGEDSFRRKVLDTLADLEGGKLDGELVYRKRLSRPPESYTASTPPQVKAARALGWKGRRGTVEYVWTAAGAEPLSLPHQALDYRHYAQAQVLPTAKSIADAAGWSIDDLFPRKGGSPGAAGRQIVQPELEFIKHVQ
jgi:DNA polymerase-2